MTWDYVDDHENPKPPPERIDELTCPNCGGPSGIGLDPDQPAVCHDCLNAGGPNHHLTHPEDAYDPDLDDVESDYFEGGESAELSEE